MKIELTQKELIAIVREHYSLATTLELEVSIEQNSPKVEKKIEPAVTKKEDVADLLADVKKPRSKKSKRSKARKYTPSGQGLVSVPKNPKLDYTVYGEIIEDFLKSGKDFTLLPIDDGLQNSGMLYRYRIAAEMFGFRGKISLNAPRNRKDELIIAIPGKAPQNCPHKKVDLHPELTEYVPAKTSKVYIK